MRTTFQVGALAALVLLNLHQPALAGPSEEFLSPIVEEGEREIDFKAGSAKSRDGVRLSQASLGLGWGVNSWWFTELYAGWQKETGSARVFDAWSWENRFQITETGKYPVDFGLLLEIERPRERSEGYELRWGALLQSDLTQSVQLNLNLFLERHVRTTAPVPTELGYQWQLKHRWTPGLEYGLQGTGDVGDWRQWEPSREQPHQAGPAVFTKWRLGDHQVVKANAAWLVGLTHGAPRNTLRLQAELEF
jgi:hypothetical protein